MTHQPNNTSAVAHPLPTSTMIPQSVYPNVTNKKKLIGFISVLATVFIVAVAAGVSSANSKRNNNNLATSALVAYDEEEHDECETSSKASKSAPSVGKSGKVSITTCSCGLNIIVHVMNCFTLFLLQILNLPTSYLSWICSSSIP
jgi:hypothetical protein